MFGYNQKYIQDNNNKHMITLIIAAICFLALIVLCCFVPVKNKTLMMSGIVMLMLLLTVLDELLIPKYPLTKLKSASHFQNKVIPPSQMLNISSQLYKNTPTRPLLKQQRSLLSFLLEKHASKENLILYVTNIDTSRFRAVFRDFQSQTNTPAVFVDYKLHDYGYDQLENALFQGKGVLNKFKDKMVYFILENIKTFQQVTALQNIYLTYNVSYIIDQFPYNLLEMSKLGKWTKRYQFEGNYIAQVLQNHPPRLVQLCNKYRTIDYSFYVMSQTEPLAQLCTKLPSNVITQCIRNYMQKHDDRLPFSKVRKCFLSANKNINQNVDGVIYDNGMIGLKKDYFYAGRVDKSKFIQEANQGHNQNL